MLKRNYRGSLYGLCLMALAGLPASAYAQVGTPPPAQGDTEPAYVAPPPPASFTAKGRAELKAQAEQRQQLDAQRAANGNPGAKPAPAADADAPKFKGIPNVQIPSQLLKDRRNTLLRKDAQGNLFDWWGPLDLHALKISPLVGDLNSDQISKVVYDRHDRVEKRMIANLDLFCEIEATKDELGQDGGIGKLSEITSIIQPIVEPGTLSIDLYNAQALSAMQAKFNEEMVRAYKREQTAGLRAEGSNPISGFVKFMVEDAMREPRFAHDLMLGELLMNYDAIVKKAGLEGNAELAPVAELAGRVSDGAPGRALISRATPYIMALPLDEHTKLLMAIRELRADPDHQPLLTVDLLKDGQEKSQMIPGDELTQPGGVKTQYAALDPDATGVAVEKHLSAEQLPEYLKYLKKAWRVLDPDATGHLMEQITEQFKPEYQKYLDVRQAELKDGGKSENPTPDVSTDGG